MDPLVSVIVPIYKVEKYLPCCIDSIISQTYKNIEIILVDDGSPDRCGEICDEYAKRDSRIVVIHKINGGLSSARNAGLNICRGDYISFIDSDDFVSSRFIEWLYDGVRKYTAEIVTCTGAVPFEDGCNQPDLELETKHYIKEILPTEAIKRMMYQRLPNGAPFRLYKRDIFSDIRFPEGYLFEDVATTHKTFIKAKKMAVLSADIYAYRIRPDSIVRQSFDDRKKIAIEITRSLYKEIITYDKKLKKAAASRALAQNFHVYLQVPYRDVDTRQLFWNEIKKYRWLVLTDPCRLVRKKNRLGALVSVFGANIAYKIGQIFVDRKG